MGDIKISVLRECFSDDFYWLTRPREHFKSTGSWLAWNSRWSGRPAFTSYNGKGYKTTTLTLYGVKHRISMHRVVFALAYGRWPDGVIDHIDGDPQNNSLSNLRDVTQSENSRNSRMSKRNTSGITGVYWFEPARLWMALIGVNGKSKFLGYFKSKCDAANARKAAELKYDFTERHGTQCNN